jgi:hypothetical protein
VTTVPDITRLLARVAEWQEGHRKPGGRADAARRLEEAHKLLDEVSNMLGDVRRELLGSGKQRVHAGPSPPRGEEVRAYLQPGITQGRVAEE